MTKILALSGKKQSGKTTSMNFLFGSAMLSLDMVEYANINENGQLVVPGVDSKEDGIIPVIFPVDSMETNMVSYISENIWPAIKNYSFADMLKSMCIAILGLTTEQCYGSNEDKETETHLRWENMPGPIPIPAPGGAMTAREVLQHVGTDIFRKMYPNVWVDCTLRRAVNDTPQLALFTDCRFPNEVEGVQNAGGKAIRFTRNPFEDNHYSETALDEDEFDWKKFDWVLDNKNMTISEQNEAIYNKLVEWDFIDYKAIASYATSETLLNKG